MVAGMASFSISNNPRPNLYSYEEAAKVWCYLNTENEPRNLTVKLNVVSIAVLGGLSFYVYRTGVLTAACCVLVIRLEITKRLPGSISLPYCINLCISVCRVPQRCDSIYHGNNLLSHTPGTRVRDLWCMRYLYVMCVHVSVCEF